MIFITGASGRLGKAVLQLLPAAIPLVRKPSGLKDEIVCDFSLEQLQDALRDADYIIHLAGSMNFTDANEMWEANAGLTEKIVAAAPSNARIILASSISVYGKDLAEVPADENTTTSPDTTYAKSKLEAERIVGARGNATDVIFRIGTIYGPGFGDYYRILEMIMKGKMRIIGNGTNRISFVHVDDVALAIAKAANKKTGKGTYVIAGESLKQKEIYAIAAKALNVSVPTKKLSVSLALFFASLEELKCKLFGTRPKMTSEHVNILASDRVFDYSRAKKELGFKPRDLKKGIIEMVKDFKKNSAIGEL